VSDLYVCMLVSVVLMLYMVIVILLVVVMFLKCVVISFDRLWHSMCVCAGVVDVRRCS
jgi:hypothetical protein